MITINEHARSRRILLDSSLSLLVADQMVRWDPINHRRDRRGATSGHMGRVALLLQTHEVERFDERTAQLLRSQRRFQHHQIRP